MIGFFPSVIIINPKLLIFALKLWGDVCFTGLDNGDKESLETSCGIIAYIKVSFLLSSCDSIIHYMGIQSPLRTILWKQTQDKQAPKTKLSSQSPYPAKQTYTDDACLSIYFGCA